MKILKKVIILLMVISICIPLESSFAGERRSFAKILREGLLGAGAGAIGGAVSGGNSEDLWVAALAGAGVNIIGGAVIDAISGEQVENVRWVDSAKPRKAYSRAYTKGYRSGYRKGFVDGYHEDPSDNVYDGHVHTSYCEKEILVYSYGPHRKYKKIVNRCDNRTYVSWERIGRREYKKLARRGYHDHWDTY